MTIQRLLVATDFSEDAERALELAIELAQLTGASVHILHSCYLGAPVGGLPEPVGIPPEFMVKVRQGARAQLEPLAKRVAQAGLSCQVHLSDEPAVTAILDQARELAIDLIAMGTRGRTGLRHVLLGSVAERVVRLAPCPVLTARAASA